MTNAYCGSLGFSNSYTRITKKSANRLLFLLLHLFLCCVLMQLDAFEVGREKRERETEKLIFSKKKIVVRAPFVLLCLLCDRLGGQCCL